MHPARRLRLDALVGAPVALLLAAVAPLGWDAGGVAARALLLAVSVTVPLGIAAAVVPDRRGREAWTLRALSWLHAPAAALAAAGLLLPQGPLAGLLCVPWLLLAVLGAIWAMERFLTRPWPLAEEVAMDAALAFLVNGALFLVLWRAGIGAGFSDVVIALTAVHFHFASFAVPMMLGLGGRALRKGRSRGLSAAVAAIVVGMPVTAIGIIAVPVLEAVGGVLVAAAGLTAAVLALRGAKGSHRAGARLLLALAAGAAFGGMMLGAAHGLRTVDVDWAPPWDAMVLVHSGLNALGFTLCGLLGWTLAAPAARSPAPGLPFSRLRSRGPVGSDFLERTGAIDAGRPAPRGLTADLGAFAGPRFHPEAVHPVVRAFYEDTLAYALTVRPEWPRRALAGRRAWARLGRRAQQMRFPEGGDEGLHSRLIAVREGADGRDDVRGWVRTRADGSPLYVAAYSTHAWRGERYANIAFPLPGGNLTSVLRWEDLPGSPGGLRLTTHPGDDPGDQGVYFASRFLALRLPINETIEVWMDGPAASARHDIRVLGIPFLTLHYRMVGRPASAAMAL